MTDEIKNAAALMGKRGGSAKSERKAEAARVNGRRGGRPRTYQIALAMDSGKWDIIDEFEARSDEAANRYAEKNHPDAEWYVLYNGQNINA